MDINIEEITIEDCIEMFEKKGCSTIANDGKVVGFVQEKENAPSSDR